MGVAFLTMFYKTNKKKQKWTFCFYFVIFIPVTARHRWWLLCNKMYTQAKKRLHRNDIPLGRQVENVQDLRN